MTDIPLSTHDICLDLPRLYTGSLNDRLCDVTLRTEDAVLWRGSCGTRAVLTLPHAVPTDITIIVHDVYTGRPFHLFEDMTLRATVIPCTHYELCRDGRRGLMLRAYGS